MGGIYEEAQELFSVLDTKDHEISKTSRSIFTAYRGLLYAKLNDFERSEAFADQAIKISIEEGERDTMAFVACIVGNTCSLMGLNIDSNEAIEQAFSLIELDQNGPNPTVPSLVIRVVLEYIGMHGLVLFPVSAPT